MGQGRLVWSGDLEKQSQYHHPLTPPQPTPSPPQPTVLTSKVKGLHRHFSVCFKKKPEKNLERKFHWGGGKGAHGVRRVLCVCVCVCVCGRVGVCMGGWVWSGCCSGTGEEGTENAKQSVDFCNQMKSGSTA